MPPFWAGGGPHGMPPHRCRGRRPSARPPARFRDFLRRFGGHREAAPARYGLALCLIEGPERNYAEALQHLQPAAANKDLPDHPYALYYAGHAQRGLGLAELAQAAARPQEAPQRR